MSSYRIGAFEALEWAWHMLRGFRDRPGGVEEARRAIQEVLSEMGRGEEMNFGKGLTYSAFPDTRHIQMVLDTPLR